MAEKNEDRSKVILGVGLIGVGVLIAIARFTNFDVGDTLWPLFIIVPGALLMVASAKAGASGKWLSVTGATTTITGLLLAYQNTFHHYESWAYAWALVGPVALGVGWMMHGLRQNDDELVAAGRRQINRGGLLFLAGAVFFELVLDISGRGFGHLFQHPAVLPLFFVGVGAFFLFWQKRSKADN